MNKYCPKCNGLIAYYKGLLTGGTGGVCADCKSVTRVELLLEEPKFQAQALKYVSIDLETTGLDPETDQILEFGAVLEDWQSPLCNLPTFHRYILTDRVSGSPFALAMNADILRAISAKQSPCCTRDELPGQFAQWLQEQGFDPLHVNAAGKNFAGFDAQFLKYMENIVCFRKRVLDPATLYWRAEDEKLPDMKTCMERAGIPGKVAHTAVEDAKVVIQLVRRAKRSIA